MFLSRDTLSGCQRFVDVPRSERSCLIDRIRTGVQELAPALVTIRFGHLDRTNKGYLFLFIGEADHMAPWMKACISSGVSLPSLLLSIPLKIRS